MKSAFLRLGERTATSNTTLLWLFVLVTLATLLTSSQSLGVSIGSIALPALVTTAIFILLVIAARGPLRRIPQPGLRSTATLGVVVAAWLIRSAVYGLLLNRQLGADGDIQVIRVVISILFVLFIMLITSDLIDHRAAHKALIAELTNRRMDLRLSQATFSERLVQARSELDQAIRGTLEPSRSLLDLAFDENGDPAKEVQPAQLLHDIVRLRIRPVLADLAASEVTVTRAPTPEHVEPLERARVNQRIDVVNCIRPALMVVPLRVFTLFVFLGFTSFVNALSSTVVLLLTWPILAMVRRFWPANARELPTPGAVLALTAVFAVAFGVPHLLMLALLPASVEFFQAAGPDMSVISVLFSITIAWCIAAVQIIERRRRLAEQELLDTNEQMQISISQMRQELWLYRRNLMWVIHGPLQSALISAALKLQAPEPLSAGEMIDLRSHIDSAYATLDSGDHAGPDFSSFLTSLCQLWDGLCTITVSDPRDVTPRIDESLPTAAAATEIVREAVGNAIRHGGATTVAISLDADDERLLSIVVTDNGTGVVEGASPGLGSDLFDALAFRWSRETSTHGTTVRAEVAWGATSPLADDHPV
jgi:two-component sensor histidine kinase